MLLALMDEAYTGSTIEDGGGDSEFEDSSAIDVSDPLFLEILKDENDGIAVCLPSILLFTILSSICLDSHFENQSSSCYTVFSKPSCLLHVNSHLAQND
jgi:hypothetical protein